jgi:hypothetical protein
LVVNRKAVTARDKLADILADETAASGSPIAEILQDKTATGPKSSVVRANSAIKKE